MITEALPDGGGGDPVDGAGGNPADGAVADPVDGAGGGPVDSAPAPPECPEPTGATGPDVTVPGATSIPHPTLRQLTLVWLISGDADEDGVVSVRYRVPGGAWRASLPLRRTPAGSLEGFSWPNRHTGTIFDLEPATTYEVELALVDLDGGCETRTLTATTRPVPAPAAGGRVVAVTPGSFAAAAGAADPGDILELATGTYPGFTFGRDGAADAPIVIRAAAGATPEIAGDVRLDGRSHIIVQGLRVHGQMKFNGALDLAIVGNHVTTSGDGIVTKTRSEDLYIADNVVEGATAWTEGSLGVSGSNVGEGIEVTGPGHVIEHNRVKGFRDCVSLLEDSGAVEQLSIDIVGNDLSECADDGIEADFCFHDCRIVRNRMTNVFMAMSSQPGLGGPTWFVRNVAYNVVYSPFKLQRGSVGDVGLHNTVVKTGDAFAIYTSDTMSRQWFRNNLFLGGPGGTYAGYNSGSGRVIEIRAAAPSVDLDHDGYGSTAGTFTGHLGAVAFASLAELRSQTSEVHAVQITAAAFAADVSLPGSPFPGVSPADVRLAAGGAAVDVGVPLAGINDGFTGAAPDLGALEVGAPAPVYGPR